MSACAPALFTEAVRHFIAFLPAPSIPFLDQRVGAALDGLLVPLVAADGSPGGVEVRLEGGAAVTQRARVLHVAQHELGVGLDGAREEMAAWAPCGVGVGRVRRQGGAGRRARVLGAGHPWNGRG